MCLLRGGGSSRFELVPIRAQFLAPPSLLSRRYSCRMLHARGRRDARKEGFFLENSTSHVLHASATLFDVPRFLERVGLSPLDMKHRMGGYRAPFTPMSRRRGLE